MKKFKKVYNKIKKIFRLSDLEVVVLSLISLIGGFFRFLNLNWDSYAALHPDERNLSKAVLAIKFPFDWDPHFYSYNGLFINVTEVISNFLAFLTGDSRWTDDLGHINLILRFFSAGFSFFSIFLFFFVARKYLKKSFALASTFLFATTVGFIQYAHYGVTESFLLFSLLILILLTARMYTNPDKRKLWISLGVVFGLSIGAKTSAAAFLLLPLILFLTVSIQAKKINKKIIQNGAVAAITSFVTFCIVSPMSLLDFSGFWRSMKFENGVVNGTTYVPYTIQFYDSNPVIYQIINSFWQVNPITIVSGILFSGIFVYFYFKKGKNSLLPFLGFSIIYFVYIAFWHAKFMRYMIPFIPFLIIASVWGFQKLSKIKVLKLLSLVVLAVSLIVNFLWAFAHSNIYRNELTRISASRWFYENADSEKILLIEHWDDQFPAKPNNFNTIYQTRFLEVYDAENDTKFEEMAEHLAVSDYYVISSRKAAGVIQKNDSIYPITSSFYKKMFSEELGYKLVKEYNVYPEIFGKEFNTDGVEESFQIYDHPEVYIFENTEKLPAEKILDLIK